MQKYAPKMVKGRGTKWYMWLNQSMYKYLNIIYEIHLNKMLQTFVSNQYFPLNIGPDTFASSTLIFNLEILYMPAYIINEWQQMVVFGQNRLSSPNI